MSDGPIINIGPAANLAQLVPAVHPDLLSVARAFLRDVEAGKIVGFAIVGVGPGYHDVYSHISGPAVPLTVTIGAIDQLKHECLNR